MPTFGDFISTLSRQAGINPDHEELKKILSSATFANYEIPEQFAQDFYSNLLTIESAKHNEKIKSHYWASFANGVDAEIERGINENALGDDFLSEIRAEKKTSNKVSKLVAKIKEAESKKDAAKGDNKKEKEQADEIARLNNQLRDEVAKAQAQLAEKDKSWHDKLKDIEIEKLLSSFDYTENTPLSKSDLVALAKMKFAQKLKEKKLKDEYVPDNNEVVLKTESDMQYFENNSPVTLKDFATSILSENKLLKTTGQAKPAQPQPGNGHYTPPAKGAINTSAFDAAVDKLIQSQTK